jgi:hypothetical protein
MAPPLQRESDFHWTLRLYWEWLERTLTPLFNWSFPKPTNCWLGKLLLALTSTVILDSKSHGTHDLILLSDGSNSLQIGRSGLLLLAFASTVTRGFIVLEIRDQDFYSLLDMSVFRNGASPSTREGRIFVCRRYVCCTDVSARVYPRCHGVQLTMDTVQPLSLHYAEV